MLFPSYFFLEKDNINLLQFSINKCENLIFQIKDVNLNKRFIDLKYKLLLFLYSLDETKKDILKYISDKELQLKD